MGLWSDGTTFWVVSVALNKIVSLRLPVPPGEPTNVAVAAASDPRELVVSWTAVPDAASGSSDIVGYEVRYRPSEGDWTSVDRSDRLALTETLTGLTTYIEHSLEVRARNSEQTSAWVSATGVGVATEPVLAGSPPPLTGLTAAGVVGGFDLSWTAPTATGAAAVTGYNLRYRTAANVARGDWVDQTVTGTPTSATLSGLLRMARYDVQVQSVNSVGGGGWATVTAGGIDSDNLDLDRTAGVWSDGTTMWVGARQHIYAYSMATGARDESKDFEVGEDRYLKTIWSDGDTMWAFDFTSNSVLGFSMTSRQRDASKDLTNLVPLGRRALVIDDMFSDGEVLWLLDLARDYAYAYDLESNARLISEEFAVGVAQPLYDQAAGGWTDGVTIWVHVRSVRREFNQEILAFDRVTKERLATLDADLPADISFRTGRFGSKGDLWADQTTMWVENGNRLVAFDIARRPGPPSQLAVTGAHAQIQVDWSASAAGPVPVPTGYEVEHRSDTESSWTSVVRADPAANSEMVSGLTNGSLHEVRVRALVDSAAGPWVFASGGPAQTAAPEAVSGLFVSGDRETGPEGGRDRALQVEWTTVSGATGYEAQYRRDGDRGVWSNARSANLSDPSARITGLVAGRRYQVRVRATSNAGAGPWTVDANQAGRGFYDLQVRRQRATLRPLYEVPHGIWGDGTHMWIVAHDGWAGTDMRAFDMATKERVPSKDYSWLDFGGAHGMASDSDNVYVVTDPGFNFVRGGAAVEKVSKLTRRTDDSFELANGPGRGPLVNAGVWEPLGVWTDGMTLWVSDGLRGKVFAFAVSNGNRDSEKDFARSTLRDAGVHEPSGLWSDGDTMWIADQATDRIFAFDMDSRERDSLRDMGPFDSAVQVSDLWGDSVRGELFVLDSRGQNSSVFTVRLPEPPGVPGSRTPVSGNRMTTVKWNQPANDGSSELKGYQVQYRPEPVADVTIGVRQVRNVDPPWTPLTEVGPEVVEQEITGLHNGQSYEVQTRSVNYETTSEWTDSITVIPLGAPGAPRSLATKVDGSGVLLASWQAPSDDGGHEITEYDVEYRWRRPPGGTRGRT